MYPFLDTIPHQGLMSFSLGDLDGGVLDIRSSTGFLLKFAVTQLYLRPETPSTEKYKG